MEPLTIIGGVIAATGAGVGIGAGARLLPIALRAHRDLRALKRRGEVEHHIHIAEHEEERLKLASPHGRKRDSSIAGICDGALRHTDGSYTCVWEAQPAPTMLAHEHVVEAGCDELAQMLAVDKPPGTVIQFRFSSGPDPGNAIIAHLAACGDPSLLHPEAARLHAMNIGFYAAQASAFIYRWQALSIWARVPVRQKGDDANSGLSAFIPAALDEMGKHDITKLPQAIRATWEETADDGVVRRLLNEEREARERAEKVFRLVERECPLSLRRFSRQEMWEAIYLGHRQNAHRVPILPDIPGLDIRDYLCGETIEGRGSHVMHGAHPAAIVSMFAPPQPAITADALRALTLNPALNFRHTVIAEFVYLDQRKVTKRLDRRIRQVRRSYTRADGRVNQSPEARAALLDLETVRDHVTGSREALIDMRFYAVIFAEPVRTRGELRQSLDNLDRYCERMITAMQAIPGVEAAREEPDSLRALYHRSIVGETDHRPVGREITEVAGSLAALTPVESAWEGSQRPHTLCSTPTGRLIGLNFFDSARISSPLALVLGEPGSGKSTFMARVINDVLGTLPEARVRAVDFGESLGPHVDVTEGRHLRFNIEDRRTINIWDYPGLESGEMPDETQIALVVMDAMKLARVKPDDNIAEDILTNVITEVYRNEVPRNGPGKSKYEPAHSHLLALLESYPFQSAAVRDRASTLALALEKYRGHPWLDAPTHPDFAADSPYDVYELDSLDAFPQDVRETLANRVAARVVRSIGRLKSDGTRTPALLVFDEVWKIAAQYPEILRVIKKGARMGRKEAVVTMLATHAYEDFNGIHDVTKTAGIKVVGKQIGDCSNLISDAGLSENAAAAISAIRQQLTTLSGVLKAADDLVAKQKNAITTMSNIGRTVRASFQLKDQLEAIVTTRLGMIKRIDDRLRNGIFDPEADLRDLDEYLRSSIGRSSQDTIANRERLARMDNQLEVWQRELILKEQKKSWAKGKQKMTTELLYAEDQKPGAQKCSSCIASLKDELANYEILIAQLDVEILDLRCQIENRVKQYNIQMQERVRFGEQVQSMNEAWSRFNNSLDELQRALSKVN